MPKVGKKHFPYTKKGMEAAKKESMEKKEPLMRVKKRDATRKKFMKKRG